MTEVEVTARVDLSDIDLDYLADELKRNDSGYQVFYDDHDGMQDAQDWLIENDYYVYDKESDDCIVDMIQQILYDDRELVIGELKKHGLIVASNVENLVDVFINGNMDKEFINKILYAIPNSLLYEYILHYHSTAIAQLLQDENGWFVAANKKGAMDKLNLEISENKHPFEIYSSRQIAKAISELDNETQKSVIREMKDKGISLNDILKVYLE